MCLAAFARHFNAIEDPRQGSKVEYPLFDVLFLTLAAVIAGCEGWEEIEDFGQCRLGWLRRYGDFNAGIPSHDTIARLISRLDPEGLRQAFVSWMQESEVLTDGQVVAIDGKTLRGSYNREDRRSMIHMVNAFATENGVVLGQYKTDAKSNEITAIPELLKLLDLKGCLVTIDAMGCQTSIARAIREREADYLLAVKNNQKKLHRAISQAFSGQEIGTGAQQLEQGHGRAEYREYRLLPASVLAEEVRASWQDLTQIGMSVYYRSEDGEPHLEYRYYISSAELIEARFGEAVRQHWGIESRLHWVLDVAMNEDGCQIYRGNGAENLAVARQVAVNQLRRETSKKAGIKRKQKMAAMDVEYLDKIINA